MIANNGKTEMTEYTKNTKNILRENYVFSVFSELSVPYVFSGFSVSDIQDMEIRCFPEDKRSVNHALFQFARKLRAMIPNSGVEEMEPYVDAWYKVAIKRIPDLEWASVWWDFMNKWESVKFPNSDDLLEMIVQLADESEPPACSKRYGGKVGRLVHILQRLQMEVGDKSFYMAGRTAAKMVELTHTEAALCLKGLVREGVLEVDDTVKSNEFRARRYRYVAV